MKAPTLRTSWTANASATRGSLPAMLRPSGTRTRCLAFISRCCMAGGNGMPDMFSAAYRWIDDNILELGRELRLSYLPPLMVYMAAGISGLTGIVGTFFVKEYLGLSAAFLAALGFW